MKHLKIISAGSVEDLQRNINRFTAKYGEHINDIEYGETTFASSKGHDSGLSIETHTVNLKIEFKGVMTLELTQEILNAQTARFDSWADMQPQHNLS